ncbi:hypothetical protein H9P43_002170 [Blastocladiella emersonii ATCC 22665]|nr:hypothetical protein H9P43_002170 [Blastocladiella emersonii ATCC 22665]
MPRKRPAARAAAAATTNLPTATPTPVPASSGPRRSSRLSSQKAQHEDPTPVASSSSSSASSSRSARATAPAVPSPPITPSVTTRSLSSRAAAAAAPSSSATPAPPVPPVRRSARTSIAASLQWTTTPLTGDDGPGESKRQTRSATKRAASPAAVEPSTKRPRRRGAAAPSPPPPPTPPPKPTSRTTRSSTAAAAAASAATTASGSARRARVASPDVTAAPSRVTTAAAAAGGTRSASRGAPAPAPPAPTGARRSARINTPRNATGTTAPPPTSAPPAPTAARPRTSRTANKRNSSNTNMAEASSSPSSAAAAAAPEPPAPAPAAAPAESAAPSSDAPAAAQPASSSSQASQPQSQGNMQSMLSAMLQNAAALAGAGSGSGNGAMSATRRLADEMRGIARHLSQCDDPSDLFMALQQLGDLLLLNHEEVLAAVCMSTSADYRTSPTSASSPPTSATTGGADAPPPPPRHVLDHITRRLVALIQCTDPEDTVAQLAHALLGTEVSLMAVRSCVALLDAFPSGAVPLLARARAAPALVATLRNIEYIDVAEAVVLVLHKLSGAPNPSAAGAGAGNQPSSSGAGRDSHHAIEGTDAGPLVDAGAIPALLEFLDFYPLPTQRLAVATAAQCCRHARGAAAVAADPSLRATLLRLLGDIHDPQTRNGVDRAWANLVANTRDVDALCLEPDDRPLAVLATRVRESPAAAAILCTACTRSTSGKVAHALVQRGLLDSLLDPAAAGGAVAASASPLGPDHVRLLTALVDAEVGGDAQHADPAQREERARQLVECLLSMPDDDAAPVAVAAAGKSASPSSSVWNLLLHVLGGIKTSGGAEAVLRLVSPTLVQRVIAAVARRAIGTDHTLPVFLATAAPDVCRRHGLALVEQPAPAPVAAAAEPAAAAAAVTEDVEMAEPDSVDSAAEAAIEAAAEPAAEPTSAAAAAPAAKVAIDLPPAAIDPAVPLTDLTPWEFLHSVYFTDAATRIATPDDAARAQDHLHALLARYVHALPLVRDPVPRGSGSFRSPGRDDGAAPEVLLNMIRVQLRVPANAIKGGIAAIGAGGGIPPELASSSDQEEGDEDEGDEEENDDDEEEHDDDDDGEEEDESPVAETFPMDEDVDGDDEQEHGASDEDEQQHHADSDAEAAAAEPASEASQCPHSPSTKPAAAASSDNEWVSEDDAAAEEVKVVDMFCNVQAVTPLYSLLRAVHVDAEKWTLAMAGRRLDPADAMFKPAWHHLRREKGTADVKPAEVFASLFRVDVVPKNDDTAAAAAVPAADDGAQDNADLPPALLKLLECAAALRAKFPDVMTLPCAPLVRHAQAQMGQVLLAATQAQPAWLDTLFLGPRAASTGSSSAGRVAPCPWWFLWPFAVRRQYYAQSCLGYARCLVRVAPGAGRLGRIQRQKVRIDRAHVLASAAKVLDLFAHEFSMLEIEYRGEVGTGLGPTLEYYALVVDAVSKVQGLWSQGAAPFLLPRGGVVTADDVAALEGSEDKKPAVPAGGGAAAESGGSGSSMSATSTSKLNVGGAFSSAQVLRLLGQLMAKAVLDDRVVDIPVHPRLLALVFHPDSPDAKRGATLDDVRAIDREVANSLDAMLEVHDPHELEVAMEFGGIPLVPGGNEIMVTTRDDAKRYVALVANRVAGAEGLAAAAAAVRLGFARVLPPAQLAALFTPADLATLFGAADTADEHWTHAALIGGGSTGNGKPGLRADHGYSADSRVVRDLVDWMVALDPAGRRAFLTFLTGAPRLPLGGWTALNPPFTVVHRAAPSPDACLPSVMTCANYLKLPSYSSAAVLADRMRVAVEEGQGSFHLS